MLADTAHKHLAARLILVSAALALTGCGGGAQGDYVPEVESTVTTSTTANTTAPSTTTVAAGTTETSPHLESERVVDTFWPPTPAPSGGIGPPLIVLVPGGGWATADPTGLIPLAATLAEEGALVATVTHRAAEQGVHFPGQPEDVACAVADAAAVARAAGFQPGEIVVFGHSSGAHLASLVALLPDEFSAGCEIPPIAPDRFVGFSGPYDVVRAQGFATDLFGPSMPDPATWSPGNPMDHAGNRPDVPVLLVHGGSDTTVPVQFTEWFADALEAGGHEITALYPEAADHHSIYSAEVAAPIIAGWLGL